MIVTDLNQNTSLLDNRYMEQVKNRNKNRINSIDFLKGISIIFVIITHLEWSQSQRNSLIFPFVIDMAVPIFMMISGYVYSLSYKLKGIESLNDAYEFKNILNKIIRYTIPYLLIYILEAIILIINEKTPLTSLLYLLITGGLGPGSYYYPIMIQFVFVFPLLYTLIKKYDLSGLLLCGGINVSYEVIKLFYGMPTDEYRLLIFRYVLLISFGSYIAIGKKKINKLIAFIFFTLGLLWQLLISVFGYKPIIINADWAGTSFMTALYIMPIFSLLINNNVLKNKSKGMIESIGSASYNIFLFQMFWFGCGYSNMLTNLVDNRIIIVIGNVMICVLFGYLFYIFESKITNKIIEEVNKKDYLILINKIINKING